MKTAPIDPPFTAILPGFPGFYCTELDDLFNREVEDMAETLREKRDPRLSDPDRDLWKYTQPSHAREAVARKWAKLFSAYTGLEMEFHELWSPEEYNFTCDKIVVVLSPAAAETLTSVIGTPYFTAALREYFTSRSGFVHYYSNDPLDEIDWAKPITSYEPPQLQALIDAWVRMRIADKKLDFDSAGELYDAINENEHLTDVVSMTLWRIDPIEWIKVDELEEEKEEVPVSLIYHGSTPALYYGGGSADSHSVELPELSHLSRNEVFDLLNRLNIL